MKRTLKLPLDLREYADRVCVILTVRDDALERWCLDLCLLEYELVESLVVLGSQGPSMLEVVADRHLPERGRAKLQRGKVRLVVGRDELEYWIAFFLMRYRDGIGAVDHIDVDVPLLDATAVKRLFLVLKVPDAVPPVSSDEARRRLGLSTD